MTHTLPHLFKGACICPCPDCTDHPQDGATRCICPDCPPRLCGAKKGGVITRGDSVVPAPPVGPRRADRGEGLPVLLFAVVVAVLAALALMSFAQGIAREAEQRVPACVVPTTAGCPDGPQP